ncbi:MAG: hypothetical protein J5996_03285, partial [Prevotella sp.]|nr:hypothetical protein [Prevotella sp.]
YLRGTLTIRYLQHADCADNADDFLFIDTGLSFFIIGNAFLNSELRYFLVLIADYPQLCRRKRFHEI